MAPEIYNAPNSGYGYGYGFVLPADVYSVSVSVLLWEFYSLKVPYGTIPKKTFVKEVFSKGKRPEPEMGNSWPQEIKGLLEKGWPEDPKEGKPSMEDCKGELLSELVEVE